MGTMIERISLLEKKYSRVSVIHADLNVMKMWLECQFGIVFPKGKEDATHEDEDDDNNPFFEMEVMRQRVANLEAKIHTLEGMLQIHSQPSRHSHTHTNFSSAVALALKKPVTAVNHRKYLPATKTPIPVVRPKPKPVKKIAKPQRKIIPPPKLTPINRQPIASRSTAQPTNRPPPTLTEIVKIIEDGTANAERLMDQQNMITNNVVEDIKIKQEEFPGPSTSNSGNVSVEESPMDLDGPNEPDESFPVTAQEDGGHSPPKLENFSITIADVTQSGHSNSDENESSFEKYEMSMSMNASQNCQQGMGAATSLETTPEKTTGVTFTARGRRHVVPRRYAEFTAHTNVTAILKKQKIAPSPKRVVKLPEKLRPIEPVKINTVAAAAVAAAASGGPSCVRALVERIENLPVDDNGMVILSDRFPHVITEQQKLLIIIQKSGGKATRLTRKITTLIFEDAVLASASPFGTKYYKDRLDPDRLEAIVDFILNSGFEQNFDEKKVYNIVAQVCNEARAGRVKKIAIKAEPAE